MPSIVQILITADAINKSIFISNVFYKMLWYPFPNEQDADVNNGCIHEPW